MSRLITKPTKWLCAQRRLSSAWASAQCDQSLLCALSGYLRTVTGRFAHFPVRHESFHPWVVSPSITWVVSPSYPESFRPLIDESFRPLIDESFRPLSRLVFYWGYCDKFTVFFFFFNGDFGYFLKHLIDPSSAEANDISTCILFKLTS